MNKYGKQMDDYIVLHEGSVVMRGTKAECDDYAYAMDANGYEGQEVMEYEAFAGGVRC